jgi:hypothetical protein
LKSRRHAAGPHDAEASLRAELSAQIAGAQSNIEHRLAELSNAVAHGGDSGALAHAKLQLSALSRLQQRIGDASAGNLTALRGEVMATVAATQALAQQANVAGAPTYQTAEVALQRASEGARVSVTGFMHEYYDRHEFDRYLKFTSSEDEEEYRRREDERKKAIDTAMAEHTPQGNLKALDLSIAQLKDAGAHGADKSAAYEPMLEGMQRNRDMLSSKIAAGKDVSLGTGATEPADTPVPADVLAQLRAAKVALADPTLEGHGVAARGLPAADPHERA